MFLYISLVDMVPELNETVERASKVSSLRALATFGLQNIGIIVGIVCLHVFFDLPIIVVLMIVILALDGAIIDASVF